MRAPSGWKSFLLGTGARLSFTVLSLFIKQSEWRGLSRDPRGQISLVCGILVGALWHWHRRERYARYLAEAKLAGVAPAPTTSDPDLVPLIIAWSPFLIFAVFMIPLMVIAIWMGD